MPGWQPTATLLLILQNLQVLSHLAFYYLLPRQSITSQWQDHKTQTNLPQLLPAWQPSPAVLLIQKKHGLHV